jgi:topoisomerase IA-like protein
VIAGSNEATIKFCDPEELKREREQALLVEKSKQEEKERRKLEQQAAKDAKEAKKKNTKDKKVCFYDLLI